MVTELGVAYVTGVTILFFFWVYGIYAFVRDLKNRYIPLARQYVRGRRKTKADAEEDAEREEGERGLF